MSRSQGEVSIVLKIPILPNSLVDAVLRFRSAGAEPRRRPTGRRPELLLLHL
jgi:hypothetical protein